MPQQMRCSVSNKNRATPSTDLSARRANPTNSGPLCKQVCQGYGYMLSGVKKGNECWCGDVMRRVVRATHLGDCNTPCHGHAERRCGGPAVMNVMPTGIGECFWKRFFQSLPKYCGFEIRKISSCGLATTFLQIVT